MGSLLFRVAAGTRVGLVTILLVATFVTTCWAEPFGVYLALSAAILSLVLFDQSSLFRALQDRGVWCFLAAFALLAVAFVVAAKKPDDGMAFVDFLALPVIVPAFALLSSRASPQNVVLVALLAAGGCIVAIFVGFYEVVINQASRAAGGTSPIFFSDMAVVLGYFALLGMLVWNSRWRWLLALANAFAVGAALYGGTRGAIVAEIAMLAIFATYALVWWDRSAWMRVTTVVGVVAIATIFSFGLFDLSRVGSVFVVAGEVVGNGDPADVSTGIRLKFWAAGLQSFLESPIYGHSWWNRFEAAVPFMPSDLESEISHDKTAHLHNDIVNFASAAGIMGIVAYFLLMVAPVVSVWHGPRGEAWRFRLLAAIGLSGTYLVMGLTDTMFVFEIPKSMFVLCSAVVMAFFAPAPVLPRG